MKTKVLVQLTEAAEMKEQSVKRFESLCSKYNVSNGDKELFVVAMCFCKMEDYESLCDKYEMAEYDRNNIARSLVMALTAKYSIGMKQHE